MKYTEKRLDGKTILITGGAGFIGSNLAFYFQKNHPEANVIVFDRFRDDCILKNGNSMSLGHFKNLIGFEGRVIVGDINNLYDLETIAKLDFDYVFHQAAISDTTLMNQELVMRTNHKAFLDILNITIKKQARVIYASSAGTYGNSSAPNIVGKAEFPENVYGFSKLCMDQSVRKILQSEPDMPIIGLRYFNVYGEREFYKGKTASMILQLALQALQNKQIKLFEFGEQQRDFVYIQDVIQANVLAMFAQKGGIYNVGMGQARSYNDIVMCLKKHLSEFEVCYIKNPYTFFQTHTQADIVNISKDLDYMPKYSLELGVQAYIQEIKNIYEGLKTTLGVNNV